ncbi:hypothetical protein AAAD23_005645 [Escherichia coli]
MNSYLNRYIKYKPTDEEVDIIELVDRLWQRKKLIIIIAFIFAVFGLFVSFVYPYKWTSVAVITTVQPGEIIGLEKELTKLRGVDVNVKIDEDVLFNLFIKEFKSASLLRECLCLPASLKKEKIINCPDISFDEKIKVTNDNDGRRGITTVPYVSWTLSFTSWGSTPEPQIFPLSQF